MIITRLIGGLGNQMFQFAAGFCLSRKLDTSLRLDLGAYRGYRLHNGFELDRVFGISPEEPCLADFVQTLGWRGLPGLRAILSRRGLESIRNREFAVESAQCSHESFVHGKNAYLVGYWQSDLFFEACREDLLKLFRFKEPLNGAYSRLAERMSSTDSVAIHVRRGDYSSNPKTLAYHGLCPLDYYRAAISHIASRLENPVFFIFSDDLGWAAENIRTGFCEEFVEGNSGLCSYRDMQLMTLCRHNIIANSSFSWWSATLNQSPQKIVIAPRMWFASREAPPGLMPSDWILL